MRTQFNTAYQEAENARLRQLSGVHQQQLESEKLTNYLMVLIIFLLISVCGLFYLLYLKKQKYLLKLENSINTDLLTQLGSRRFILERLDQLVEKLNNSVSISTGGQKTESAADHIDVLTLAMLDMDFFKSINDKFGHLAGDDVLKCFGKIAKEHFSDDVFLGRMGGEEFLFIFPQKSASQCLEVLESFRIKIPSISKQLDSVENAHKISISIGMFQVARGGNRVRALNRVDDALLEAKENGRDRVVVAQSEDEFFAAIAKRSPSI